MITNKQLKFLQVASIFIILSSSGYATPTLRPVIPTFPLDNSSLSSYEDTNPHILSSEKRFQDNQFVENIFIQETRNKRETVILIERFPGRAILPGSEVSIFCGARGPARITWTRDGVPYPGVTPQHTMGQSSSPIITRSYLNISKIAPEEAGLYACTATALDGSSQDTHAARIDVYGPPYIRSLPPIKVLLGGKAQLYCPYYGYPISKIQWDKGDRLRSHYKRFVRQAKTANEYEIVLNNLNRIKRSFSSNEEGLLTIEDIDSDENGFVYTCTVSSPNGEMAKRSFEIQVLQPPILDDMTFGSNIKEGEIAKVICSVKGGDTPVFFSWFKDGMPISASLKIEERNLDLFSVLVIRNVGLQHCGTYMCVVSNHASRVNVSTDLYIKVAPKWIDEPSNSSVVLGKSGQISCSASGYPQPQVHWMKKDESSGSFRPVLELVGSGLLGHPNGTLIFETVSLNNQGEYSCQVENGVGQPLTKNILVSVKRPVIFEIPQRNLTAKVGQPISIICDAVGDHPIRITWTHNGRSLEFMSNRMKMSSHQTINGAMSELILASSDPGDGGHYQCRATNPHGTAVHNIFLVVQEPPGPPMDVSVEGVWGRRARIGWRSPPGPSPIAYLLQYTPNLFINSHPNWDTSTSINITSSHGDSRQKAEISGLRPATLYTARISSVGQIDMSAFSTPLLFTTLEEAPSSPPLDIQVEMGERSGELLISWLPPPQHTFNGILLGYIITAIPQINEDSEENTKIVRISNSEASSSSIVASVGGPIHTLRSVVGSLLKSTRYSIAISCYNSAGTGPTSSPVYRTTREGAPEVSPDGLECSPITSMSIRLNWRPLPNHLQGGAMLGYIITYTTQDGYEQNITTVHSSLLLQGLIKYTNYSLSIAGYYSLGAGPFSSAVFCKTHEDLPGPPSNIKTLLMTSNSIVVSWLPPLNQNGIITHYTVYVKPSTGGTLQSYRFTVDSYVESRSILVYMGNSVGGFSHSVRGLNLGKKYETWTTATTSAGEGETSRIVSILIHDRIPAGVSSLGGKILIGSGTSPKLWCNTLGSPQPRAVWYHDNRIITHHPSFSLNSDDSLLIHNIEASLEGNYTCLAKNLFGSDKVTYLVGVVSPPSSPILRAIPTSRAFTIHWSPPQHHFNSNKSSHVIGYHLRWKELKANNWENIELSGSSGGNRYIDGLKCGTEYEIQLTAQSRAGESQPAAAIIQTLGSVMTAPAGIEWIWRNSTHFILDLNKWIDGHCGPVSWRLYYRPIRSSLWLQTDMLTMGKMIIGGLYAGNWYELKIGATNQAGSVSAQYTVSTKSLTGEEVGPPSDPLDTSMWIMICSCILLLLCMLVCIFAAIQKHRHRMMCESNAGSVYKERAGQLMDHGPPNCPPLPARLYTSPIPSRKPSHASSEMFEISPYAQFTMGFQTFGHVDNQDRPAYIKGKQAVFSTETSFQMGSESEDSDSVSKSIPMSNTNNKLCRVQYHR